MKLEKFKEKNSVHISMIVVNTILVILTVVLIFYKSFALYDQRNSFEIINGKIPDQNYDAMLSFYVDDGNGNQSFVETMPTENGHNYEVIVTCNNGATGEWDYNAWAPTIYNLTNSRTKCKLIFELPTKPLMSYGIKDESVTTGTGLYEVTHEDAEITYTTDTNAINNLKQTEYRYAGKNPNNYVTFNDEVAGWRIIGLVNTPEGQRLKLVRVNSIGSYSWDSSASNINTGAGVNEWSQADIKTTLNSGAYYNRTSGTCYNGRYNVATSCDFSSNGLINEAKEMIDMITWNTGSQGNEPNSNWQTTNMYNYEKSNNTGKICSSEIAACNDSVTRTTTWKGQVGLMYPSDYGYATSGGSTQNRNTCLDSSLFLWNDINDCKENDWIHRSLGIWLITPLGYTAGGYGPFLLDSSGQVTTNSADPMYGVIPSLYLKTNIKVASGQGTEKNPYVLSV